MRCFDDCMATLNSLRDRKITRILWHAIGLSSIGSALVLQSTVFLSISKNGYFRGAEYNPSVLALEVALTGCAIVYFFYMVTKLLRSKNPI